MPATIRSTPIQASGRNEASGNRVYICWGRRGFPARRVGLAVYQLPVRDPVRPVRIRTLPSLEVLSVFAVRAFKPHRLRVSLERKDVRRDSIEKPPVVRDHNSTAGKIDQSFLECSQSIDIKIVRRLIKQ